MIHYSLVCSKDHHFQAWFPDSAAYDKQRKARVVQCPVCGDAKIRKAPMAPALAKSGNRDTDTTVPDAVQEFARKAAALRDHVEKNCENVGEQFADEARRIHYGEADERGIYGVASDQEAKDLDAEGIAFGRLPGPPRRDS